MAELFDLDVVAREQARDPFQFRFTGQTWQLPHLEDLDWSVLEAADRGDAAAIREALRIGLGEQWPRLRQQRLSLRQLNALFTAWQQHAGVRPGESPASTGSSRRTGRRSTRTLRPAT